MLAVSSCIRLKSSCAVPVYMLFWRYFLYCVCCAYCIPIVFLSYMDMESILVGTRFYALRARASSKRFQGNGRCSLYCSARERGGVPAGRSRFYDSHKRNTALTELTSRIFLETINCVGKKYQQWWRPIDILCVTSRTRGSIIFVCVYLHGSANRVAVAGVTAVFGTQNLCWFSRRPWPKKHYLYLRTLQFPF